MKQPTKHSEEIRRYIEQHCCRGLTVKELAEGLHMDPGNLDHDFRQASGMTIGEFNNQCRKRMMLDLVRTGGLYGYEIAAALGFKNDKTFYRWVKRQFGMSWSELIQDQEQVTPTIPVSA